MINYSDVIKNFYGFTNGAFDYVPPCERKPYYDDPRDNFHTTGTTSPITLTKCRKCGVYFDQIGAVDLCDKCLEEIGKDNSQ